MVVTCRCNIPAICMEVKKPGPNRGRWYWRCPNSACRFFQWENSAFSFITHPSEAYAAIEPFSGIARRPASIPYNYSRATTNVLPKTTVKVVFLVLSKTRIGMKMQRNPTIEPVIEKIRHIEWDEKLNMWTLPANNFDYVNALRSIPTDLPNIQVDIDPLPEFLVDSIINSPKEITDDPAIMSDMELKLVEFIESPTRRRLKPYQREGVRIGIERGGRILFGNENGLGVYEQALALADVYHDEWPALIMCDKSMCHTWKELLISFLDLEHDEICIIDDMVGPLFKDKMTEMKKRKRSHVSIKSEFGQVKRARRCIKNLRDSDDSESDEVYEATGTSNIKFYIASHKKVSNNKSKILEKGFRVIVCDASHYLRYIDQNQAKNLRKILESQPRAILISELASYALPVDIYTQLETVKRDWLIKYELFVQRYCNPKNTVFGVSVNGRSNMEELQFLLDSYIWYVPKIADMKPDLPHIVRQRITLQCERKEKREILPYLQTLENGCRNQDEYIERNDLMRKNSAIKTKPLLEYIEYVFDTHRRPKLGYLYLDKNNANGIMNAMTTRKMKFCHIDSLDNLDERVADYNQSKSVQGVIIDMNLEYPSVYFSTVDIVIVVDLPTSKETLDSIESLFKCPERDTPLIIKYVILDGSIDEYLCSELCI